MEHVEHLEHTEAPANMKQQIWRTFWILLALTIVDIVLYFILPTGMPKNTLFIVLGVVKAFFIVAIFMHMKFERKFLVWMIVGPMLFIGFLIWLALLEADFTNILRW